MKLLIKLFIINTASLFIISKFFEGLSVGDKYYSLFVTGAVMTAVTLLGKPIIKILLLPLNLITFGFFNWVSSAFVLYIVGLIIKDFKINYFSFEGLTSIWLELPSVYLQGFLAYVAFSFVYSIIYSFFHWLIK